MLRNIQAEGYQRKAKSQLQNIKHNLKLLDRITQELNSMSTQNKGPQAEVALSKSQKYKVEIKQKLKCMSLNISQLVAILDYKIFVLTKQFVKLQKNPQFNSTGKFLSQISKSEEQYKYQINQLEQRIFQIQKKENQYVKEISQLKEKNAKLRQQFSNLSFDSNQRIKQLSEKLHNNTSPNLTIRNLNPSFNPQTNTNQENYLKKSKNNFVKIKNPNHSEQELSLRNSNNRKLKNMLDSLTSEKNQQNQQTLKINRYEIPQNEHSLGFLKFGCFPEKQSLEITKDGSTSQNKKTKIEQNLEKNRRFEFLLSNLIDKKRRDDSEQVSQISDEYQQIQNVKINKISRNQINISKYMPSNMVFEQEKQYQNAFNNKIVKKYHI